MSDLIERQAAIDVVHKWLDSVFGVSGTDDSIGVFKRLRKLPTIDAEPVRYGHWIERYGVHDGTYYKCSVCNYNCSRTKENYCSYCGAKMDGGKSDERSN